MTNGIGFMVWNPARGFGGNAFVLSALCCGLTLNPIGFGLAGCLSFVGATLLGGEGFGMGALGR